MITSSSKLKLFLLLTAALSMATVSCSRLTREAKAIAGSYFIPEISEEDPLLELNSDATCILRAIKPGVISYSLSGRWNVKNDSLVVEINPESLSFKGDSSLIGTISEHYSRKITGYNDLTLTLEKEGVQYVYYKRGLDTK